MRRSVTTALCADARPQSTGVSSGGVTRSWRSTTAWATTVRGWPLRTAWARSRACASRMCTSSWAARMPLAWWTTDRTSKPAASSSGAALGLHPEHPAAGEVGEDERVGVLVVGEAAGGIPVEVEGAEAGAFDGHREPEHGSCPGVHGRPGEGRPPGSGAAGEKVGLDGGLLITERVDARSLTVRQLQLLEPGAHSVGGAHGRPQHVVDEEHDPRAGRLADLGADAAQIARRAGLGRFGEQADDVSQPLVDPHRLRLATSSGGGCTRRRLIAATVGRCTSWTQPARSKRVISHADVSHWPGSTPWRADRGKA